MTESKGTTTGSSSGSDPDAISWLQSTLHSVDQRCNSLQNDLKKAQQVTNFQTPRPSFFFLFSFYFLFIFFLFSFYFLFVFFTFIFFFPFCFKN